MPCLRPIDAYQPHEGAPLVFEKPRGQISRELRVKCRRCIGCRIEDATHWTARGMCEQSMHPPGSCHFATLTYDDEHLPLNGNLIYSDYQQFARYVRRDIGPFRYMVTGEYGEKTGRPHFHAHLFGLMVEDLQIYGRASNGDQMFESPSVEKAWGRGSVILGEVNPTSLMYTTGYALKDTQAKHAEAYLKECEVSGELVQLQPPFMRTSRKPGIGGPWFDKYATSDVFPKGYVTHFGKKYYAPGYYLRRLEKLDPELYAEANEKRLEAIATKEYRRNSTRERLNTRERLARNDRARYEMERALNGAGV